MNQSPRKSTGGRAPERAYIYQLHTASPIPCTTIWWGTQTCFNISNPKPFSFEIYVTDAAIPTPPSSTPPPASQLHSRIDSERSFVAEFLYVLTIKCGDSPVEPCRRDLWWVHRNEKAEGREHGTWKIA